MNGIDSIDYGPLEAARHTFRLVLRRFRIHSIVVVLIAVVAALIAPSISFGVLLVWFVTLMALASGLKNSLWEEFAAANSWPINAVQDPSMAIPFSLEFGHSQQVSPAITATLNGIVTDMFVYTTVTGEGRYQEGHNFTLARVELPIVLPHILLRSKKDKALLQQDFADHEKLQLEGDFDDYFSLQIESGQEVDALTILTPDVMQTLVSYSQHEDIEIGANNLYFIIAGDARSVENLRQLIQSVVSLSARIIEHIDQTTVPAAQSEPDSPVAVT